MDKKKILGLIFIAILFIYWEFVQEVNFLNSSYPTIGLYFDNRLNSDGILEISGDWVTSGLQGDTYSSPAMSDITCIKSGNSLNCKEVYMSQVLGSIIPTERFYNTILFNNKQIILNRITKDQDVKMEIIINLEEKSVVYNQIPLSSKTGNPLLDIGKSPCVSKLVSSFEAKETNRKYRTNFVDTPLLYILYKIKG